MFPTLRSGLKPFRPNRRKDCAGQSLSEYGLVVGLLAVACLVALTAFGKGLLGATGTVQALVTGQTAKEAAEKEAASLPVSGNLPIGSAPPKTSCFNNGWCVTSALPVSGNAMDPMTTGANGVQYVNGYADVLSQLAQTAAQNPALPPDLSAKLTALANAGHSVADTEVYAAQVWVDTNYAAEWDDSAESAKQANITFGNLTSDLKSYLAANPGLMSPEVLNVITQATDYIQGNGNLFNEGDKRLEMWSYVADTLNADVHQQANTVCTNGGDTTQCVQKQ